MASKPIFEPKSGMSFNAAAAQAIRMAKDLARNTGGAEKEVLLEFSDQQLSVTPDTDPGVLWKEFCAESERRAELQRPAEEARLKAARAAMDKTMAGMDEALAKGSSAATLAWLQEYAPGTSFIGVDSNKDRVLKALNAAGYVSNEFGTAGWTFAQSMASLNDRGKAERFMIGQLIYNLEDDAPLGNIAEALALSFNKSYPLSAPAEPPAAASEPSALRLMRPLTFKNPS